MTTLKDSPEVTARVPGHVDALDAPLAHESHEATAHVDHLHGAGPLARVWRFFISMRTGLMLILILGALTLLGTLLMQATDEIVADPATYQQWYQSGPALKYGGWAPVLSTLGVFHIFSTWYFRALFAILALSILACSINRAPRLWHSATQPKTSMGAAFYERAPLSAAIDLPVDADRAAERVRAALRSGHFRALGGPAKKGFDLYGDRFRWGPFGTVLAHLSFVVILAGFVVSATMGFKESSFVAPIGTPMEVGHGTGLTVVAHSFNDSYYDNGAPKDYVSDVSLMKDGKEVARQEVRVNNPLRFDGVWFHQAFFGVGADIKATADGKDVFAKNVPLQWQSDDGQQSIGQFTIPEKKATVYVIEAASGKTLADLPAGSAALEVHTDGVQNPEVQVISQGKSATIQGVTYTYERNRQYTGLTINRDPGSILVWIGSALLLLGSAAVFFFPHRRVWARVRPNADGTSRVLVGASARRDPAFEPAFETLVHRISSTDE